MALGAAGLDRTIMANAPTSIRYRIFISLKDGRFRQLYVLSLSDKRQAATYLSACWSISFRIEHFCSGEVSLSLLARGTDAPWMISFDRGTRGRLSDPGRPPPHNSALPG